MEQGARLVYAWVSTSGTHIALYPRVDQHLSSSLSGMGVSGFCSRVFQAGYIDEVTHCRLQRAGPASPARRLCMSFRMCTSSLAGFGVKVRWCKSSRVCYRLIGETTLNLILLPVVGTTLAE